MLLNVDLGELPGEPDALYACAHLANVACGGHAGDDASMRRAVALCLAHGTRLGAHPSYPDREGFGRRRMQMEPDELCESVAEQCTRLAEIARAASASVAFVKPHGALYHAAQQELPVAEAVVRGAIRALGPRLTVVGPALGHLAAASRAAGLGYAREAFADRAARADGTLVPRTEPGALILDPAAAAERARSFAVAADVEAICVHGDTPGAVAIATAVRKVLDDLGGT